MHINSHPASRSFHLLARYLGVLEEDTACMLSMRYVLLVAGTSFESRPNRGSSTLSVVYCGSILFNFEYDMIIKDTCNEFGKKENQTSLNQGYNYTVTCTNVKPF